MRYGKQRESVSRLESDCIAILAYVANHRDEPQTYQSLSDATGIPMTTLREIIMWPNLDGSCGRSNGSRQGGFCNHPDHKAHWALSIYGQKYGYSIRYIGERGKIIDVERYAFIQTQTGRLLLEENSSMFPWTEAHMDSEADDDD